MNCVNCEREINGLPCCYCGCGMGKNIKTQEIPSVTKPMNTWEVGGGSFLCASEEDAKKCMKFIEELKIEHEVELQHQREEIVEKVEKLETHSNDWVTEDVVVKNDVLDIIKKVGKHD